MKTTFSDNSFEKISKKKNKLNRCPFCGKVTTQKHHDHNGKTITLK